MSQYLRSRIMRNAGKYIPRGDQYEAKKEITSIFRKYSSSFERLAVKQIIPEQFLQTDLPTIKGYSPKEVLQHFEKLSFIIPTIYLPRITNDPLKESWATTSWSNDDLVIIDIKLGKGLYLPRVHDYNTYDDNIAAHRNNIVPDDELLLLLEQFATEANAYLDHLAKHTELYYQLFQLLHKFHTTKQLTDAWPEIEAFIPSEFLSESIKQKKAKKVSLSEIELNQIDAISKELLIQKMLIN